MTTILGIESSCDETSVAIVNSNKEILFHEIFTQDHEKYGGVFPELASREHLKKLPVMLEHMLKLHPINEVDAIAYTKGPGLIGSLIVGSMMAQGIAFAAKKPIIPINHLEGHILSTRLSANIAFPFLCLLISGGHSQILEVKSVGQYRLLGQTLDDAFGEAFDKVAKMMALPYPGGKIIEQYAYKGNPKRFQLPKSMEKYKDCNFSLSGIKTAVRRTIEALKPLSEQDISDLCASFQECVCNMLLNKLKNAFLICSHSRLAVVGGVASNMWIRSQIEELGKTIGFESYYPPRELCTDNAAMIAWAAIERINHNLPGEEPTPNSRSSIIP